MTYEVFLSNSRSFSPTLVESSFFLGIGSRVVIRLKGEERIAYVVGEGSGNPSGRVESLLDTHLDPERVELALWISKRYVSPPGMVLDLSFPSALKSYIEERVIPTSDLVSVEPMSLEDFLEKYGEKTLKKYLEKGYVKMERTFVYPRVRHDPESEVFLRASISEVIRADLSPSEKGLVDRLVVEGSSRLSDLLSDFSRSTLKSLESKGIVGIGIHVEREKIELTQDQKEALSKLKEGTNLLMGPTGSGKTEIYLELMKGKKTLYLVPEVALIPQTLRRIKTRLPEARVAVYHGYLSASRKAHAWMSAVSGDADVLLGTRSSIFVPRRWDLVVVDEEHDESYYQREGLVYDGVEVAVKLAELYGIPIVLGSATPRLDHYFRAKRGDHNFVYLRRSEGTGPKVEFINMREEKRKGSFSERVLDYIERTLRTGKKVMVFVRRKGFSRVVCERCGFHLNCPNCDVNMVFHSSKRIFKCHVCGYEMPAFDVCPVCGGTLKLVGAGTERVERDLRRFFPSARIARADREVLSRPDRIIGILNNLSKGKLDILVGTRMISKGIDLPRVGLMVVMGVDGGLAIPDFSSRMRVFREIVQASGRTARRGIGRAVVQYYELDEDVVNGVLNGDTLGFYDSELSRRERLGYPPFKHLVHVVKSSQSPEGARSELEYMAEELRDSGEEVLGPAEHPIFRVRGRYRYHIVVKTSHLDETLNRVTELLKFVRKGCKIFVDPPDLFGVF